MPFRALITGITGQDGAYLSRLLLNEGYHVEGTTRDIRSASTSPLGRIGVLDQVNLHQTDLMSSSALAELLEKTQPDEIYHLASQSSIARSFAEPLVTGEANGASFARLLESVRQVVPKAHLVAASSADIFGTSPDLPQTEKTAVCPNSPYGAAKAYAFFLTKIYRESYGIHASSAILYNHESPLRPAHFVTRKVTRGAAQIKLGLASELSLGNLEVRRDWGFAEDYMQAVRIMASQPKGDDFIISTGVSHALRDFVRLAFEAVDLDYQDYVRIDPKMLRPVDEVEVVGDASKARRELGWRATMTFEELVESMVLADMDLLSSEMREQSVATT